MMDSLKRSIDDATHRDRRLLGVAMVASIVLVTIGVLFGVVVPGQPDRHPGVEVVEEYLTAVKDRDVDAARALVRKIPDAEDFLAPEALDSNWSVIDIARLSGHGVEERVEVAVTIASADLPDVTQIFEVFRSTSGEWEINNGFSSVTFSSNPMGRWAVNDLSVPIPQGYDERTYSLFPGLYRFNDLQMEMLRQTPGEPVLLMAEPVPTNVSAGLITVTEQAEDELQTVVEAHIDDCAATSELGVVGCPFGATWVPAGDGSGDTFDDVTDVVWTVIDYPVVTGVLWGDEFAVVDRQPGLVELSGTGDRSSGGREDFSVTCAIVGSKLTFEFDSEDGVELSPVTGSGWGDIYDWTTCEG